jgi:hypothetical protein
MPLPVVRAPPTVVVTAEVGWLVAVTIGIERHGAVSRQGRPVTRTPVVTVMLVNARMFPAKDSGSERRRTADLPEHVTRERRW